jgi:aryl-alcohol dehydrogenase-like predicted oxidoreductase
MEYIKLGTSDLKITRIAFGAWAIGGWMWGGADREDAKKAIRHALELGMTSLDTAPAYGFGLSEELIGEEIQGKRDKVQILTKYGLRWDVKKGQFFFPTTGSAGEAVDMYRYSGADGIVYECEQSLRRLKTDYIDLYQIHWSDPTTPIAETMEAVAKLIKQGKIRVAGVCNYNASETAEASRAIPIASVQVPYSMVNRAIEKELVPWCLANHTGILAYSPLQRGLLTGKIKPGHVFNPGDTRPTTPYYKEPNLGRILGFLESIQSIAQNRNISMSQLVLNWTLQQPAISCVLAGARDARQVEENAGALAFTLSKEELILINRELEKLKLEI